MDAAKTCVRWRGGARREVEKRDEQALSRSPIFLLAREFPSRIPPLDLPVSVPFVSLRRSRDVTDGSGSKSRSGKGLRGLQATREMPKRRRRKPLPPSPSPLTAEESAESYCYLRLLACCRFSAVTAASASQRTSTRQGRPARRSPRETLRKRERGTEGGREQRSDHQRVSSSELSRPRVDFFSFLADCLAFLSHVVEFSVHACDGLSSSSVSERVRARRERT